MNALTQITKEDVDSFKTSEQEIPSCQLTAKWTKKDKKPSQLTHRVTLEGAKEPNNYFHIVLDSTEQDKTKGEIVGTICINMALNSLSTFVHAFNVTFLYFSYIG